MSYVSMVMKATIKNSLRLRSVVIVALAVVFICVIGVAVIFATQFIGPGVITAAPDRAHLENFLGLILFTTSFLSIGILANVNAFQSLVREKARGNIQALLATPLEPNDVWVGKSLAIFLPGLIFAAVMTIAAFLVLNYIYFVPSTGFLLTPWMLINSLAAVPLVYLAFMLLVHEVGLAGKPATANIICQVFLPVMVTLMINLAVRGVVNAGSWLFTVVLVLLALIIGITVLALRSRLTTERIVLS